MTDVLQVSVADRVATITMNRPERLNALSAEMQAKLQAALHEAAADPAIGAVVLTGAGRAFCAGGDVKGMAERNAGPGSDLQPEDTAADLLRRMESSLLLHEMPKPTIAMVNGVAAGAGLSLALACDLRIAARSARFTTAFLKIAASGDYGSSYFLTHLVGPSRARELFFLSDVIDAERALTLGMLTEVVEDAVLADHTMALARRLANGPRIALAYAKRNLNAAENGADIRSIFQLEAQAMVRSMQTEDHREAARAFVEKRAAVFRGR
jgi:2-(1,2-epoxy-1,2-dihydrophenyl)acetyl-CoA isomerase